MKNIGFLAASAIMGMAVGATAMAAVNCPKVKRMCRTAQRKMSYYIKKMGL